MKTEIRISGRLEEFCEDNLPAMRERVYFSFLYIFLSLTCHKHQKKIVKIIPNRGLKIFLET